MDGTSTMIIATFRLISMKRPEMKNLPGVALESSEAIAPGTARRTKCSHTRLD